jgi:hypothetical protein
MSNRPNIRVLIANLSGVIAEIVTQAIQQEPGIEWLGNVEEWGLAGAIAQTDILILGVDDVYTLPEHCFRLLGDYPNLKILLLMIPHNEAIAYWRTLHCQPIKVTSSQSLIESIHQIYSLSPL